MNLSKSNFIAYSSEGYKQQIIIIEMTGDDETNKDNVFTIEFMNVGVVGTLAEH